MRLNNKLGLVIFLGFQILLISVLKNYPQFVEHYYSNGIYVFVSGLMRYVFGWAPFSVGDIIYTISAIYIMRWVYINFNRIYKDTLNWVLDIAATVSILYFAFHLLWAFNYYRQPLYKTLNIKPDYTTEQLITFTKRLIQKSNNIHKSLSYNETLKIDIPYSKSQILNKVKNGYENLSETYPHLNYHPKSIKKSLYSIPLTYMGFSGYLNPFTNEAQIDGLLPTYKFPTTASHEVAHQLGYAAENEANFIGSLAAMHNNDVYFNYSGYTFALRYCLADLYKRDPDQYENVIVSLHPGIIKNYQEVQAFWMAYENPLEPVFEKTFDHFLKANNQTAGTKSYSYVVALLVNYYDDRPL